MITCEWKTYFVNNNYREASQNEEVFCFPYGKQFLCFNKILSLQQYVKITLKSIKKDFISSHCSHIRTVYYFDSITQKSSLCMLVPRSLQGSIVERSQVDFISSMAQLQVLALSQARPPSRGTEGVSWGVGWSSFDRIDAHLLRPLTEIHSTIHSDVCGQNSI